MCGVRFQLNVDKSDVRNMTKYSPFAFAFTEEIRGDGSIYWPIKKSHY